MVARPRLSGTLDPANYEGSQFDSSRPPVPGHVYLVDGDVVGGDFADINVAITNINNDIDGIEQTIVVLTNAVEAATLAQYGYPVSTKEELDDAIDAGIKNPMVVETIFTAVTIQYNLFNVRFISLLPPNVPTFESLNNTLGTILRLRMNRVILVGSWTIHGFDTTNNWANTALQIMSDSEEIQIESLWVRNVFNCVRMIAGDAADADEDLENDVGDSSKIGHVTFGYVNFDRVKRSGFECFGYVSSNTINYISVIKIEANAVGPDADTNTPIWFLLGDYIGSGGSPGFTVREGNLYRGDGALKTFSFEHDNDLADGDDGYVDGNSPRKCTFMNCSFRGHRAVAIDIILGDDLVFIRVTIDDAAIGVFIGPNFYGHYKFFDLRIKDIWFNGFRDEGANGGTSFVFFIQVSNCSYDDRQPGADITSGPINPVTGLYFPNGNCYYGQYSCVWIAPGRKYLTFYGGYFGSNPQAGRGRGKWIAVGRRGTTLGGDGDTIYPFEIDGVTVANPENNSTIIQNGSVVTFTTSNVVFTNNPADTANFMKVQISSTVLGTLRNLFAFLVQSTDTQIVRLAYRLDEPNYKIHTSSSRFGKQTDDAGYTYTDTSITKIHHGSGPALSPQGPATAKYAICYGGTGDDDGFAPAPWHPNGVKFLGEPIVDMGLGIIEIAGPGTPDPDDPTEFVEEGQWYAPNPRDWGSSLESVEASRAIFPR